MKISKDIVFLNKLYWLYRKIYPMDFPTVSETDFITKYVIEKDFIYCDTDSIKREEK